MINDTSVTIVDVARLAGVSTATVSRVLNNSGHVNEEREKKVLEAINTLDYHPHAIAQSLKNRSTKLIGCILSDIANSYLIQVARAIEDVVSMEGYSLIMSSHQGKKDIEEKQIISLLETNVAGMVINTTGNNDDLLRSTMKKVPTVLLHRDIEAYDCKYDFTDSDNLNGAYLMTCEVLQRGYRNIGVINGLLGVSTGKDRNLGFRKAITEKGKGVQVVAYNGDFTIESGYNGARFLLNYDEDLDAMIVMNNNMAIGALQYLFHVQKNIPEDIGFVSYGNLPNTELCKVNPAVISISTESMGWQTAKFLLQRIGQPELPSRKYLQPPVFVPGNTL